jgi:hypothetical protein
MTEPSRSKLVPTSRFSRFIFGSVALVSLLEALKGIYEGQEVYAAERFVAALVWGLLTVLKAEWGRWSRWLVGGLFTMYLALVIVDLIAS